MHSLPVFIRLKGRAVILIGTGEAAEAKRRLLERACALVVGESDSAALAIVALADPDETVARLKARGILVNAVDRSDLCDFTLPAILDRHPVLIALGTGGASAGLAKALRQRLELLLPASLGQLATALNDARATVRRRWPDAGDRRQAIDAALAEGGPLDPLSGRTDVAGWLEAPGQAATSGCVRIALSSPDPDDLTLKQARLLASADRVYHAADVPAAILDRARADARRVAGCAPDDIPPGLSVVLTMAVSPPPIH